MLNPVAGVLTYDMSRCLQCFFSSPEAGNRIRDVKISDLRLDRMGDGYGTVCTDHGPRDRHRLRGRRMQRASRRASSRAARSIANGREKGLRSWHFAMGTIGEIWGLGEICIPQGLSLRNHLRYDYMRVRVPRPNLGPLLCMWTRLGHESRESGLSWRGPWCFPRKVLRALCTPP